MSAFSPGRRLARWLPGVRLLLAYDRSWWRHDLIAGLVVTLVAACSSGSGGSSGELPTTSMIFVTANGGSLRSGLCAAYPGL